MPNPEEKKKVLTDEANQSFEIVLDATPAGNLPTVAANANVPAADATAGGLTYATARPDEREEMDRIMASIDLTRQETIIALGQEERQKLGNLSDQLLDSIQPNIRLAFAEALKTLLETLSSLSLEKIRERIEDGTLRRAGRALWNALKPGDETLEVNKVKVEKFMTTITDSRKVISEMTDTLQDQQVLLDQNYGRILDLGAAMVEAAQRMRVIRAATAEYIRRVDSGENTVLIDLKAKAEESNRADDGETYRTAQANWNALRTADGNLLGSINVYDMNVANLAFTKEANLQNRLQTENALANTVNEWKAQLAMFAVVLTEQAAANVLNIVDQLSEQSLKQNKDLFETLVDTVKLRAGKTTYSIRQIMEMQTAMGTTLETFGTEVEARYKQLEEDKKALEVSSAAFRRQVTSAYETNGSFLGTGVPKPDGP